MRILSGGAAALSLVALVACGAADPVVTPPALVGRHAACDSLPTASRLTPDTLAPLRFVTLGREAVVCAATTVELAGLDRIAWVSSDPSVAEVDAEGRVTARGNGAATIRATFGARTLHLPVEVSQLAVALVLGEPGLVFTDQEFDMRPALVDSAGHALPGGAPVLELPDGVLKVGSGRYRATQVGPTAVAATVDGVRFAGVLQVDGLAAWDGDTRLGPGTHVVSAEGVRIENGRLRIRFTTTAGQRAGAVAEVATPHGWVEGTSSVYGDWTYVAASVITAPTRVTVTVTASDLSVSAEFDDHRFDPASLRHDSLPEQAYPFTKRIVLRLGEDGYFTWVDVRGDLPDAITTAEHEVGFGGLWGPGTIENGRRTIALDTLQGNLRWNLREAAEAFDFRRQGEEIGRVLVPLVLSPVMTPVFSDTEFGAVYLHGHRPAPYGAYLAFVPPWRPRAARTLCGHAWTTAPFPVPETVTEAHLATCGPAEP